MQKPAKKKSSYRLSSLFSISSSTSDTTSAASSSSSSSTVPKTRQPSAQHLSPNYPPPAPPQLGSIPQGLTIVPVESAPVALQPLSTSRPVSRGSRGDSPARRSPLSSGPSTRPGTPNSEAGNKVAGDALRKRLRRKSKIFTFGSSSHESVYQPENSPASPLAWIVGHEGKVPYNLALLLNGEKVPELWDAEGDTFVYLFPRTSGKGPSFRIHSSVYNASKYMTRLVHGRLYSDSASMAPVFQFPDRSVRSSSLNPSSRATSPERTVPGGSSDESKGSRTMTDATEDDDSELHMYLPISLSTDTPPTTPGAQEPKLTSTDVDTLIAYRNFFAFLVGQSLVATERRPSMFEVFLTVSDILQNYQFSNFDGSTYGEVAASSFESYVDELHLADVRHSREKTVEAIVLGEKMRCVSLFTEGFVHGVGKYDELKAWENGKKALITPKTTQRLSRAAMDLDIRIRTINLKLKEFDFPAIFSGIMNSDTADEGKIVRFKAWRASFMAVRSHIHNYYKSKYGSWPPKASSKKNDLTTSGLNRLVLRDMYNDLTDLYDLLVDRSNLTTRTTDQVVAEDEGTGIERVAARALRCVMSEYDRSTPPVLPPIPFDTPLYPTLTSTRPDFPTGNEAKDTKARSKKIKDDEISNIIKATHNSDAEQSTPFLDSFRQFEIRQAHGKTITELGELRCGQWLFLYAVLQSLPILVIDVPGVKHTEGVEYFLCEPPRNGLPWVREDTGQGRSWYGVGGSAQVVSLPADIIEFSIEGVYRRSHCWKMAEQWTQNDSLMSAAVKESLQISLPPPPGFYGSSSGRNSPAHSPIDKRGSVIDFGLESLPLPAGVSPLSPQSRPGSSYDPNKTFDSILGSMDNQKSNKKKK
ncbi:hypothetical protein GQ43DRAFT_469973 [Delitschia confertaspora ATCC 74209]|uniref:DUF8004 domain-containing protein n=1 Tax=Delitschia confertaspora ATCC 74209 TaxID=1513339 RepID=A0A9P4JVU7_9PLEO|nr:hypothetical protein GQ43DRAFT_469973 [Delitschia confertaspora ATCC 74209]